MLEFIHKRKPEKKQEVPAKVLVCCLPKTGSTYITKLLTRVLHARYIPMIEHYQGRPMWYDEQSLSANAVRENSNILTVSHQHSKASQNTLEILREFSLRPVILTRNIYDILISHYYHIENETRFQPIGYIPNGYMDLASEKKLDFLIDIHLPWMLNFLMSWEEAGASADLLWMTYEGFFSDQHAAVRKILNWYNLHCDEQEIRQAMQEINAKPGSVRMNTETGDKISLSDFQKSRIIHLFDICPFHDRVFIYNKIGLQA